MQYYQYWPVGLHFGAAGSLHRHMVEALAREVHDVYKFIIVLYNLNVLNLILLFTHVGCTAISELCHCRSSLCTTCLHGTNPLLYTE